MYKIVSKIIIARMRPYLDKLISLCQLAFVQGRKGIDNDIIAYPFSQQKEGESRIHGIKD